MAPPLTQSTTMREAFTGKSFLRFARLKVTRIKHVNQVGKHDYLSHSSLNLFSDLSTYHLSSIIAWVDIYLEANHQSQHHTFS
jgi:hypothetical protein